MGYFGLLLIVHPLMLLITASILLATSFGVLYIMKRVLKLSKEESSNENGSLAPLAWRAWVYNLGALTAALIIIDLILYRVPYFNVIYSEFATIHAHTPELIYIACLALLHAALLLFSYFSFKKSIQSKQKRKKMYIVFIISSALVWALYMGFVLGCYYSL